MEKEHTVNLQCSFCGKSQREVAKLIAGPSVCICNECIGLCNDILEEEPAEERESGADPKRLLGLHLAAQSKSLEPLLELRRKHAASLPRDVQQGVFRLAESLDALTTRVARWTPDVAADGPEEPADQLWPLIATLVATTRALRSTREPLPESLPMQHLAAIDGAVTDLMKLARRFELERRATRTGGTELPIARSCSFCGKSEREVRKLVAGPTIHICEGCIRLCNDILAELDEPPGGPVDAPLGSAARVVGVLGRMIEDEARLTEVLVGCIDRAGSDLPDEVKRAASSLAASSRALRAAVQFLARGEEPPPAAPVSAGWAALALARLGGASETVYALLADLAGRVPERALGHIEGAVTQIEHLRQELLSVAHDASSAGARPPGPDGSPVD